jgi:hypothetical protein
MVGYFQRMTLNLMILEKLIDLKNQEMKELWLIVCGQTLLILMVDIQVKEEFHACLDLISLKSFLIIMI